MESHGESLRFAVPRFLFVLPLPRRMLTFAAASGAAQVFPGDRWYLHATPTPTPPSIRHQCVKGGVTGSRCSIVSCGQQDGIPQSSMAPVPIAAGMCSTHQGPPPPKGHPRSVSLYGTTPPTVC